jgi:hypothetical protein
MIHFSSLRLHEESIIIQEHDALLMIHAYLIMMPTITDLLCLDLVNFVLLRCSDNTYVLTGLGITYQGCNF